jgi:soluble lytic murein transglycosylase-like protein
VEEVMAMGAKPISEDVYEIAVDLKTNFVKELLNATAQLNKFSDRAATISKTSIGSLESLNRQFTTTIKSMYSGTSSEMQHLVSAISSQVGILETVNKKFVAQQTSATNDLKRQYDLIIRTSQRAMEVAEKVKAKKEFMGPTQGSRVPISDVRALAGYKGQLAAQTAIFANLVEEHRNKLITSAGSIIKKNVSDLTTASVRSLEFIEKTANDIMTRISRGKFAASAGNVVPINQLLKLSETLSSAKEGRGAISSLYRDQSARLSALIKARKEMEFLAKIATSIDVKDNILAGISAITKMEEQTRQSMTGMRSHIQKVNLSIKSLVKECQEGGIEAGRSLRNNIIRESSLDTLFSNMVGAVGSQIANAANATGTAFVDATRDSRNLNDQLNKIVEKLKQQRREADALRKTGNLPEYDYSVARDSIDKRLEQIGAMREKLKLFVNDFKAIGMTKGFDRLVDISGITKTASAMENFQRKVLSFDKATRDNLSSFMQNLRPALTAQQAFDQQVERSSKNLAQIWRLSEEARRKASESNNDQIRNSYLKLSENLKNIHDQLVSTINTSVGKKIDLGKYLNEVKIVSRNIHEEIQRSVPSVVSMKQRFDDIHSLYDNFTRYQQETMKKWFVGSNTRNQAKQTYNQIREQIDLYREEYERIKTLYNQLKTVERLGLGNRLTDNLLKNTKATLDTMRVSMLELARVNDQAGKKMEMIQQKTITGAVRSGWELVRNFRWQTAALAYFVYAAVNNVKRFVLGVFDEIYEFRKQALSLAASFSYQMLGDTRENFEKAYGYARNVLVQMQLVAAKTSLTMEDMFNLIRTFAQAGIIPKDRKDIEYIATIGTAIQAVTEGMANAGVQMRQELSALILGRQRATDSLAMMFQFMGVNIKEMLQKAKDEGRSMIEVMAEALKPYNEMMGKLADEWGSVKNRIDIAWQALKRFALEGFLEDLSKTLGSSVGKYFDETTGNLTNSGKQIAQVIRGIYETSSIVIKSIIGQIGGVFSILNEVLNVMHDLKFAILDTSDTGEKFEGQFRGVLNLFKEISYAVWLINHTLRAMVLTIKLPIVSLISLVEAVQGFGQWLGGKAGGLFSGKQSEQAQKGAERLKKAWENLAQASADVWNLPSDAQKDLDAIEASFKKIRDLTKQTADNSKEFISTFKLPVDARTLGDQLDKLKKSFETKGISESTVSALSEKFNSYSQGLTDQLKQVTKANDEIEAAIQEAAKQYGVSADIIRAVAWNESQFNPNAISTKGAQGIMQIMPKTGKGLGLEDPFNIKQNISAGAKYLRQLIDQFNGDLKLVFAAYNAGPNAVLRAGGIPKIAETVEYVNKLLGETNDSVKTIGLDFDQLVTQGPAKFAEHAKEAKEDYAKLEIDLNKNINAIKELIDAADRGSVVMSDDKKKFFFNQMEGFQELLKRIKVYYALIDAEQKSKTDKWNKEQDEKNARAVREYDKLMRSLSGRPMTMLEKFKDWESDEKERIAQLIVTNSIAKDNINKIWADFDLGKEEYWNKLIFNAQDALDQLMDRFATHKVKTPFEAIDIEFQKYLNELREFAKEQSIDPDTLRAVKELLQQYKNQRIELEKVNQTYEARSRWIDVSVRQNEYLATSYSPIKQELASMNALTLQHARDLTEVEKNIAEIQTKYTLLSDEEKERFGTVLIDQRNAYEENVKYMQLIFEREFYKKQHPLWSEIVEMSKSWADSMTDALALVADDLQSFGKNFKKAFEELQKTIFKDVTRALIKRYVTNPIMDMLGSAEKGSPSPMGIGAGGSVLSTTRDAAKEIAKLGGKGAQGAMDALVAQGKPIPVYVVADPGNVFGGVSEAMKQSTNGVVEAVKDTNNSINENTNVQKGFFNEITSSIGQIHSFLASGGLMGANGGAGGGGLGGMLGGAWDWVKGLFGGSTESGITTNTPNSWTNWAAKTGGWDESQQGTDWTGLLSSLMQMGSYFAFADGGKINEHIIGKGLKSGATYSFGENGPEIVSPMDKFAQLAAKNGGESTVVTVKMPITLQAIDTQTGVDFLMKNSAVLEHSFVKMFKNNRRIVDALRRT